jgi:hypothetical protein
MKTLRREWVGNNLSPAWLEKLGHPNQLGVITQ